MSKKQIRYYNSFTDDFVESKNQDYELPKDYKWIRTDFLSRFLSGLIYSLALVFSSFYCRLLLHVRFKNSKVLKQTKKTGAFIYANHTQIVGDVFNPALCCFPNRIYTVVSTANYGIPVIGKILYYLGALPITKTLDGMKKLSNAMECRLEKNRCIVIYPEAHVWEYFTDIRPFADTSFKFPVKFSKPVFCMTTTYQKQRFFKKPKAIIYIDGPFYPDTSLSLKEQAATLRNTVYECMKKRSLNSNCEYIEYKKR